jgi:integrase/recombinase XerC
MRASLDAFVQALLADHLAPRTATTYGAILKSLSSFRADDTEPLTQTGVEAFLARPRRDGSRRAASARNLDLAAIRSFAVFARRRLGWMDDPTEGIPFVREAPRDPAVMTAAELGTFFEVTARCSRAPVRSRNLALVAVLSQVGLRVHEAVGLDLQQVDLEGATLIAVRGKGGTVHDLPLNRPAVTLLRSWIDERGRRPSAVALFLSARGTRLSIRAVESMVARIRRLMGSAKHITPHTMRHTAATLTLSLGTDLSTVAELLRHSDINTTRRYLHLVDTRRREAVRRLEGTVPSSILSDSSATAPLPEKISKPSAPGVSERPVSRPRPALDDEHGLVAA